MTPAFMCVCVCVSVQRHSVGVPGQRDHSSGVPAVGGPGPDPQGEDRQGPGTAVPTDRSVPAGPIPTFPAFKMLLMSCI